jgi:hypothetical protein
VLDLLKTQTEHDLCLMTSSISSTTCLWDTYVPLDYKLDTRWFMRFFFSAQSGTSSLKTAGPLPLEAACVARLFAWVRDGVRSEQQSSGYARSAAMSKHCAQGAGATFIRYVRQTQHALVTS